jgi:hypothetical protein
VNQKEADYEHVLSNISEMTSVIGSGIPKRKFQIYSLQSTDADNFGCYLGIVFSLVSDHKFYIFSFCGVFCSQILYTFYKAREITQTFSKFCICYEFIPCHL